MTKIFESYSVFLKRDDKKTNGVDADFAEEFPEWENMNETNEGCWRCSGCSDCYYQKDLRDEDGAKRTATTLEEIGFPKVPIIENIHQKVYDAAN